MLPENNIHKLATPQAEINIDLKMLRSLIDRQFPQFKSEEIKFLGSGWDNEMYTIGNTYIARLPRRKIAVQLIENEQKWLAQLKSQLPIAISAPAFIGSPDLELGFPWTWSIVPFFIGKTINNFELLQSHADQLIAFFQSLHIDAPTNAPYNSLRADGIASKSDQFHHRLNKIQFDRDDQHLNFIKLWERACSFNYINPKKWIHGDFHSRNIIANQSSILAVIDWGDMTYGDPCTDLSCIWQLFDTPHLRLYITQQLQLNLKDQITSMAWAAYFGTFLIENGKTDNPEHLLIGKRTIKNLLTDMETLNLNDGI